MSHPVPLQSFLGGLTIPLPVHALTLLNGNVFGISGFLHRAVKGNVEGAAGVAGLVLGGMLIAAIDGGVAPASLPLPIFHVACSGFLVGLGTKVMRLIHHPRKAPNSLSALKWMHLRVRTRPNLLLGSLKVIICFIAI